MSGRDTATARREAGNAHFKAGRYAEAETCYAETLELLAALGSSTTADEAAALAEDESKCRLNRCACLLRLQGYAAARAEAEAVIALSGGSSAKAHFRLGQALDRLQEPRFATAALTQAIRLDPKAREPRQELEAARARLKAHPRLELLLDDLRLVEERAVRALLQADVPRARQQMELLLKDARAQAASLGADAAHWECRALLGLAFVCAEESESEAAQDYTAACRRVLGRAGADSPAGAAAGGGDLRAECFHAHVAAQLCLDTGTPAEALPFVRAGLEMALSMRDEAMQLRLLGAKSVAHSALGQWGDAEAAARAGLELARETGDKYGEAVCQLALGKSLRAQRKVGAAAEALRAGFEASYTLGGSHALAAAHSAYAVLQLEFGQPTAERVASAMEKLSKARDITKGNGLARAACDDAHNLYVAAMRTKSKPLRECVAGLRGALHEAGELGYSAGRVRLSGALALALLGGSEPGAPVKTYEVPAADATTSGLLVGKNALAAPVEPAPGSAAAVAAADALLTQALELASGGLERADLLSVLSLRHLVSDDAGGAAVAVELARGARQAAREAGASRAADDANLGVALLMLCAEGGGGAGDGDAGPAEWEAEAVGLLEAAAAAADGAAGEAVAAWVAPPQPSAGADTCVAGIKACRALALVHAARGRKTEAAGWAKTAEELQQRSWVATGVRPVGTGAGAEERARARAEAEAVEKLSLDWGSANRK